MTTRSAGEPSAELLSFDSEFWGVRIAKAPTLMDDWALDNTIGCMWLLIPAHEQTDIHRAESGGARVMDVRVKLERDVPLHEIATDQWVNLRHAYSQPKPLTPSALDKYVAIARTAFRGLTRFYADPRFPDERCDDLYENWLRDSADGWAAEILTIALDGRPCGFITIHVDEDTASIGLIAVSEKYRGSNLGMRLTSAAVNWAVWNAIPKITVVTQGCNTPALRTFQGCGFRTCQTDIWLHKWFYD